jgi:hypothetical protein
MDTSVLSHIARAGRVEHIRVHSDTPGISAPTVVVSFFTEAPSRATHSRPTPPPTLDIHGIETRTSLAKTHVTPPATDQDETRALAMRTSWGLSCIDAAGYMVSFAHYSDLYVCRQSGKVWTDVDGGSLLAQHVLEGTAMAAHVLEALHPRELSQKMRSILTGA